MIGGGSASGNVVGGVPPLPPRGIPAGGGYRLFGANLEVVLDHEQTPYQVPLIVKRCIDEVEKRGLDIIGLYRLCGAETKKNMLRAAFEESPDIVDLSSENVPDINVITSKINNKTRTCPCNFFFFGGGGNPSPSGKETPPPCRIFDLVHL